MGVPRNLKIEAEIFEATKLIEYERAYSAVEHFVIKASGRNIESLVLEIL